MSAGSPTSVAGLQQANPNLGTVERQPQTSAVTEAANAPFIRSSRKSRVQGYASLNNAFGAPINLPLKPVGGYLRGYWIKVVAAGGTGGGCTAKADAPENIIQNLLLKDAMGTPIVQTDGFGLAAIMRYSGQFGMGGQQDPRNLPSYSAVSANGNFTIQFYLPLELDSSAYCSIPSMNASAQPTLQINLNAEANVFSANPATTQPTMSVYVDEDYWAAPINQPDLGPPDVGSSSQWSQTTSPQLPGSGAFTRPSSQRVGTLIHTLICVLRDSTGARVANFPLNDLTLAVDGVPVLYELLSEHYDEQYRKFNLATSGTVYDGVVVYTFRDAVQQYVSSADTHDNLLPTTPATLLELCVGTYQTITNSPATLTIYTGELWPSSGIPYNHLAA